MDPKWLWSVDLGNQGQVHASPPLIAEQRVDVPVTSEDFKRHEVPSGQPFARVFKVTVPPGTKKCEASADEARGAGAFENHSEDSPRVPVDFRATVSDPDPDAKLSPGSFVLEGTYDRGGYAGPFVIKVGVKVFFY